MILGIDPKNDYAFKFLFGSIQRTGLLIHLLNSVLKLPPERRIVSVELLNPITEKVVLDEKLSILDIKARDQTGRLFNIEMQMINHHGLHGRILYYWAKVYSRQLTTAEEYERLQPVISICFLDGVLFPQIDRHHSHFQLLETEDHIPYSEHMQVHIIQLPLFTKKLADLSDPLDKWLYFLNNGEYVDTKQIPPAIQEPEIIEAVRTLEMVTLEEIERERYLSREKARMDALSWHKTMERLQREAEQAKQEFERARQEFERAQQESERVRQESERVRQESERVRQEAVASRSEGRAEGRAEGKTEGLAEGLIGQIGFCEQLLQQPITAEDELRAKSMDELQQIISQLRQKLLGR